MIGYVRGDGPGSDWLDGLRTGDSLGMLGPRRSLDLGDAGPRTRRRTHAPSGVTE